MRRSPALLVVPAILVGAVLAAPTTAAADGVLDTITVGNLPRSVVFTDDGPTAYVSNEGDDTVSRIDVASGVEDDTVTVADAPREVVLRPGTTELWVTSWENSSITIVDTTTFSVVTTLTTGTESAWSIVFDAAGETAYISNYGVDKVTKMNADSRSVLDTQSSLGLPQGLSITADGAWLYVAGTNTDLVYKLSTATLDQATSIPVGDFPVVTAWAPDGTLWVSNNGDGVDDTVSVIDPASDTVVDTIAVAPYPRGMAFSPSGHAWVASQTTGGGVVKIDAETRDVVGAITTDSEVIDVGVNPVSGVVYATDSDKDSISVIGIEVDRLAGVDRFDTAVRISQSSFQSGAPVVFIATGLNYPDALAAGPAAGVEGGPVLLTAPTSLPAVVKTEIERLNPASIVILGATPSVSTAVANELATIAPVTRIDGANRYETGREIVREYFTSAPKVYLSTGQNFPDALGGGNAGASLGVPVVLVNGGAATVDAATLDLLDDLGTTDVTILGGPTTVSTGIQSQLANLGFTVERLAGADRFETSLLINQDAFGGPSEYAILATGLNFPDALAGASIGAKVDAPLYAIPSNCVPAGVLAEFDRLAVSFVALLGGPTTLTVAVEDLTPCS